jgi:environmental stress-induced protein Ves
VTLHAALSTFEPLPWKNGAGFTRQLAAGRGWRVSLAEVTRPCSFSVFEGLHRHSIVVAGDALQLRSADAELLLRPLEVASYPGDTAWDCLLTGRGATVFNVMVQPGVVTADVFIGRHLRLETIDSDSVVILPVEERVEWSSGTGHRNHADTGSVVVIEGAGPGRAAIRAGTAGCMVAVRLRASSDLMLI